MKQLKYVSVFIIALMLTAVVGCASTSTKEGTGEYVDDTVITTKVKAAIFNEPTLKSAEINVETFKGVVQLTGFVSTQANINKAAASLGAGASAFLATGSQGSTERAGVQSLSRQHKPVVELVTMFMFVSSR